MVRSLTSTHFFTFTFLPRHCVFDQTLIVFIADEWSAFAVLMSRLHESWALFFGATMKDDPRYNTEDCLEPFPFPASALKAAADSPAARNQELRTNNPQLVTLPALESAGRDYYEFRAALMIRNNEGLTKTYNRFHDPYEKSPDILKLRELHAAMDRAVLEAYGWHDLAATATCEFLLDYEDEADDDEPAPGPRPPRPPQALAPALARRLPR